MPETVGRGKRWLFTALTIVVLLLVGEIFARVGLGVLEGGATSLRDLESQRRETMGEEVAPSERERQAPAVPRFLTSEVLHPYQGFVFDRDLNFEEKRRERGELEITELGFFREPGPPPELTGREFRIGIFGGSAAFLFSFQGRNALVEALSGAPVAEAGIVVESYALGGYKQPQQLMTLAYLLSLGERFDIVVNLDGFNDVVLAAENAEQGVFPHFPRSWPLRVGDLADPELLKSAGELVILRRRRQALARAFSKPVLRRSAVWNLLWRVRDRRLLGRIAALETDFASYRPKTGGYQALGPSFDSSDGEALFRELAAYWASCSLQMHHLALANGIRYYHALQPNQYLPGSKPMGEEERRRAYQEDNLYRRAVELGYPHLRREGEELTRRGVAFLDLTQIFADLREPIYVDTCCHVNDEGNERIAEIFAREILEDLEAEKGGGLGD